ncbi:MAG: FliA/WhiG family RNA polymerase sigma factor [Plesiomonas sp.]|uniref:FliA/WhiG family RNA polymerase sigma factor n=1 Tax=Plesiomonas sp. TaxID=2486279 RepID=UPI003EE4ED1A
MCTAGDNAQGLNAYQASQKLGHQAREQRLLLQHAPLVRRIACHLALQVSAVIGRDDLEQIGMLALLGEIRRYDPDSDIPLEVMASPRIRGAMLDELRRLDWRSRGVRQKSHELKDRIRSLSRELGRKPTRQELALALQISDEELHDRLLACQAEQVDSLDSLQEDGFDSFGLYWPSDEVQSVRFKRDLSSALKQIPEREQTILCLYYEHEMNLKEIALVLDLTEARICQLHKKSLKHLNRLLDDWNQPD